jgi:hypothetical protein
VDVGDTSSWDGIELINTSSGSTGTEISFKKDSSTPANDDYIGVFRFYGDDSGGAETQFANFFAQSSTVANGSETGMLRFRTALNGAISDILRLTGNKVSVNSSTDAATALEVVDDTGAQLRLTETATVNYADFTVDSSGVLKIEPSGKYVGINRSGVTPLSIQQKEDNKGVRLYGYDDMATSYWNVYLNSAGNVVHDSSGNTTFAPDGDLNFTPVGDAFFRLQSGKMMEVANSSNDIKFTVNEYGTVAFSGSLSGSELSSDPSDPAEGKWVMWQSDGTGTGDDGDILIKITAGGSTKTTTLVDFSSLP